MKIIMKTKIYLPVPFQLSKYVQKFSFLAAPHLAIFDVLIKSGLPITYSKIYNW